jgi:hypothetical protein
MDGMDWSSEMERLAQRIDETGWVVEDEIERAEKCGMESRTMRQVDRLLGEAASILRAESDRIRRAADGGGA